MRQQPPVAGDVAGLFAQLAGGGVSRRILLAGVQQAGGDLQERAPDGGAVLLDEQDLRFAAATRRIAQGDDGDRAGMLDDLDAARAARRLWQRLDAEREQLAAIDLFAGTRCAHRVLPRRQA